MVTPRTILITGCNSGIGLMAAKMLFRDEANHRLLLVARSPEKAETAKKQIAESFPEGDTTRMTPFSCDMSSFSSIHQFSKDIHDSDVKEVDVVCLNAGICTARNSQPQYTEDNLELTLATNHFGPFLLMHKIMDLVKPGGRVVVTASEVQNMKQSGELPTFEKFRGMLDSDGNVKTKFPMMDGSEFHYFQAYQHSKLCNVTFTAELNRRLEGRNIVANCFSPGFMPQTGFFRHQNAFLLPLLKFSSYFFKFGETVEWGACALVFMATHPSTAMSGGQFWNAPAGTSRKGGSLEEDFKPRQVNPEATNADNQATLWKLSAQIVGIGDDDIETTHALYCGAGTK